MTIRELSHNDLFVYELCYGQKDGRKGRLEYSVVYQMRETLETCAWCKQDGLDKVGIYMAYAKYVEPVSRRSSTTRSYGYNVSMALPICLSHVASAIADI